MSRISKMTRAAVSCMAVALVSGVWAETWTDSAGYTWTYRISGNSAEINNGYSTAISPRPYGAVTVPSSLGGKPVTSIGDYAFEDCRDLTSVTIPDSVTSIGREAFSDCSELANVVIGSGVTSIGDYAFEYCRKLKSVEFKGNAPSCYYLFNSYDIPDGCEAIVTRNSTGWGVKEGELWHGLVLRYALNVKWTISNGELRAVELNGETDIRIPSSVTKIGSYAFNYCSGLKSVVIGSSVTSIGASAFAQCSGLTNVVIGSGVTSIGDYAFYNCSGLTSVTIPDSVTNIGASAFSGCSCLASVTIPDSVTRIGDYAFCYCRGLTSITIPASVTSIGAWAFAECNWVIALHISDLAAWCKSLPGYVVMNPHGGANLYLNGNLITALTIPASVTSIKSYAFYCLNGLTSVTIPNSVTSIGSAAFSHCHDLTSVKIGNGVKSIGDEVFLYCGRLLEISVSEGNAKYRSVNGLLLTKDGKALIQGVNGDVTIPDSVTSIGERAFYGCSGLTSVTIPDGVTSIGASAFYNCSGLASVTIPDSVTNLGNSAFYNCSGLKSVTFLGNAPAVNSSTFYGVNSSCVASVSPKSTGWGVGVGEKWNGLTLQYWPEVLTAAASDAEVGEIMAAFSDKGLAAQVSTVAEYDAFRSWVSDNNLYQPNVVESTRTWLSYALGADALIGKEITSNDVRIVAFEATDEDGGTMGSSRPTSFMFEVAIDGVNIGGGMVAAEILKENLKKVLDVEGATTLSPDAFSSDNVEISFDMPVDGKVKFTASSPNDIGSSFFMRVKVK